MTLICATVTVDGWISFTLDGKQRTCLDLFVLFGKTWTTDVCIQTRVVRYCCQTSSLKLRPSRMYFQLAFNVCELKRTELTFNVPFRIYHGNGEIKYGDNGVDISEF